MEILKDRGFNVEDWSDFSVTEIQAMYNNKELDMLLENPTTNKKIYVKYHLATRLGSSHIYDYVDDLFDIEDVLSANDDLIIISKDKTNLTIRDLYRAAVCRQGSFMDCF